MAEQEREHIASMDCWCNPRVDYYGSTIAFDEEGEEEVGDAE